MDIANIASQEFFEVDAEERFGKIRAIFEEENPKGIVVSNNESYRGMITERQILKSHIDDDTKATAMASPAPKVRRTEDVRDVARMLVEGGTKVAPVFEGGTLWGIITEDAILEAVLANLDAITVDEIYSDQVVTVRTDTSIGRAINLLREHGISRLPVLDDDGLLTGVVTVHDLSEVIIRDMDAQTVGDRAGDIDRMLDLPVYDAMNTPVETITVDATVKAAVEQMFEYGFAGLIVTPDDNQRAVAGVVTKTDVLRAISVREEDHLDVQITNIDLLGTLGRTEIRESITDVVDKYRALQVQHAHVRFQEHKEAHRGVNLLNCQIRLRTDVGQIAGSGEGFGADASFRVALDKLQRNVLEKKGTRRDQEHQGELLRKLGEL